jgi:hypothetical protein
VIRPAETTALGAGRRAEKHEVAGQVERLHGDATNVHAVPFANEEGPLRCVSGLECLFVDGGAELCRCGSEATPTGTGLATADGPDNAHTTIRSINANLDRRCELFVVQIFLYREWFQGEGAARRFGEKW